MEKHIKTIIIFLALLLIDCGKQTRRNKNIEVHGRLVNFYSKEPISNVEIRLRANDAHSSGSYSEAKILLDSYVTNSDGTFILKSKASKQDNYQLQIDAPNHLYSYSTTDTFFTSKPDKVVEFGDLYFGEHRYWYKVRFIPTSGSCAWVSDQKQQSTKINAGIDTTILYNTSLSYYFLRENKNTYWAFYTNGSCTNSATTTYHSQEFQITSADTILVQVNY
jgi:hypothetical protein